MEKTYHDGWQLKYTDVSGQEHWKNDAIHVPGLLLDAMYSVPSKKRVRELVMTAEMVKRQEC